MTPQSSKAKGRRLQQFLRDRLIEIGRAYGLEEGDIESRSMGANGTDLIFSPAAKRLLGNFHVESKNVESLNVTGAFWEHAKKYPGQRWILCHKRNHTEPLITITMSEFSYLLEQGLRNR